jgi:thiol-disulfide isomerase/thioredoxin
MNERMNECIIQSIYLPLLIYYNSRCGHCRAMAEDWDKLGDDYDGHDVALIAEVDCTSDEGQPICEDFDVQVRNIKGETIGKETKANERNNKQTDRRINQSIDPVAHSIILIYFIYIYNIYYY